MADITVKDLAKLMKTDDSKLLKLLNDAGMNKQNANDVISDEEKNALLTHIQAAKSNTVVVKRKSTQQIKVDGNRKINIEVRKKRKIVLPTVEEATPDVIEVVEDVAPQNPVLQPTVINAEPMPEPPIVVEQSAAPATVESKKEVKPAVKRPTDMQKKHATEVDDANVEEVLEIIKPKTAKEDKPKESGFRITERPAEVVEPTVAKEKEVPKRTFNNAPKGRKDDDDGKGRGKAVKKEKGFKKANAQTVYQINGDFDDGFGGRKGGKRSGKKVKTQEFTMPVEPVTKQVVIYEGITVHELAQKMAIKAAEVIKVLFKMGVMATINQSLDQDTAILIVEEMGHKYSLHREEVIEDTVAIDHGGVDLVERAPVVTIMGHVDHGKTSLLDYIRKTKVASGEAGGITQHIGAYSVKTDKGQITFLDTPGHEAFTAMRARGASSTDIVILVVAADDGVMPQTIEAIQHSKAAGVPIIVAVNKMDKPAADPDRVKHELASHDVIPEDWGGEVMFAHVSAHSGQGIDALLDGILLQSEVLELKSPKDGLAKGVVIESRLEKGRGAVATVLVQSGTLKQGDILLCGTEYGRVRAMTNCTGQQIKSAGASTPVEILGLSGVPNAGDEMIAVKDDKTARDVADHRLQKQKEAKLKQQQASKLSSLFDRMGEAAGEQQTLNVIVKADVQGSVEAIRESLIKLSTADVKVDVIASGIGGITSSDISLAVASGAVVFGFNVRADGAARKQAEAEAIELRYYSIIYDLIDDVKQAMTGLLSPEMREQIIGIAQVRDVFRSSKFGSIAGCMVIEGAIKRNNPIRVLRDQVVIYEGSLESLKRFKEDASEVKKGMECGIGVKNYNDIKVGDQIEVFEMVEFKREI